VGVSLARINDALKVKFLAIQPVYRPDSLFDVVDAVHRRGVILVAVKKQDRPRRDESDNGFSIEMVQKTRDVIIDAVGFEELVPDDALVTGEAADGDAGLEPFVQGHQPPRAR